MYQGIQGKIYRHVMSLPANAALHVINLPPVEARLRAAHERHQTEHARGMPRLSSDDQAIVDDLDAHGVHITTLDKLAIPGSRVMFGAASAIAELYSERVKHPPYDTRATISAEADDVLPHPEIFRWGASERILRIVEAYLKVPVAYDGMNLFYTVADGRQAGTRLWHRDREDRRMVKVAIYLNDVDEGGGPLQIVHRHFPDRDPANDFTYPALKQDELEARLKAPIRDGDVTSCTGPAGTVIFSDTASHYHRGKPAVSRDRGAVFFNYFSRVPRHPFFCERSGLSRAQIAELARGLSEEQRACIFWRDALPPIAKLVPPSLV